MSSKRLSLGTHFLSSKKKEDLTELFQSFDKDNDGKISCQEFNELLHSTGIDNTTAVTIMVKEVSNDNYLDFEGFAKIMRPTLSDPHGMTKKQQELKEAFDAFDKDGDGTINQVELQAMMEKLGDKISLEEAKLLIDEVDLDKDGAVNFNEFSVMMGVPVNKDIKIMFRIYAQSTQYINIQQLQHILTEIDISVSTESIRKTIDLNKDNKIDFYEFVIAMSYFIPSNQIEKEDRDMLSCFLYFDKDHDGRISQSELESVMKMLDAQLSPEEIKEMIKLADINKDGFVDFEEFRLLVASN
ncbi:hypothetical protein RMCBS344292_10194 [Rhizopus microsporus]|nr:hypothetical protein RMCBS344292_10194 [Rhizopus microsporus]